MKARRIINFVRPIEAPVGWEIYNAPRPLYGTIGDNGAHTWQGEFIEGIFYAAIDPQDPEAGIWHKENQMLHAVRLEFISADDVVAEMMRYYQKKYSVERVRELFAKHPIDEDETRDMLIQTWFNLGLNWVE